MGKIREFGSKHIAAVMVCTLIAVISIVAALAIHELNKPKDTMYSETEDVESHSTSLVASSVLTQLPRKDEQSSGLEIVCWGDSLTAGEGAGYATVPWDGRLYDVSFMSYPDVLERLTGLPTYNFGIPSASSDEILFLQSNAEYDDGYYELESDYLDSGTAELMKTHKGDILVLEIGSNGGWYDYDSLIEQYRQMVENAQTDRYIIIGDTDDPGTSIADWDQGEFEYGASSKQTYWEMALEDAFGEHFINMRMYLVENGLGIAGLTATAEDIDYALYGCVSPQLRDDWTHLNSYGYFAQAYAVHEKGKSLGYWD